MLGRTSWRCRACASWSPLPKVRSSRLMNAGPEMSPWRPTALRRWPVATIKTLGSLYCMTPPT